MIKKSYLNSLTILSLLGFAISLYLAVQYAKPSPVTCLATSVNTCEIVRNSEFSSFFGISTPIYGVVYFGALAVFLKKFLNEKNAKFIGFPIYGAFAFETYLTHIQLDILNVICTWCLSIEIITFISALVVTAHYLSPNDE